MIFQGLLRYDHQGKITGAMSPVMVANEFSRIHNDNYTGLVRINFENPEVHNFYEAPGKRDLTGFDTLLLLFPHGAMKEVVMIIDMGSRIMPVAMYLDSEPDQEVTISPIYKKYPLAAKLTNEELKKAMQTALSIGSFTIKPYTK